MELETAIQEVLYEEPPPTPEQFLDPDNGWITPGMAAKIREWVKADFYEILSWKGRHRVELVQYGATRRGKSFLAILLLYYQVVHSHYLRSFTDFYMMAEGTNLAVFILSFNYPKVNEIYLSPFFNLLEASERCIKVKYSDAVKEKQEQVGKDYIVWSKASLVGEITLASGLQIVTGNDDALNLVGNNILAAFISEINFWCEYPGASEDSIYRLYSDVKERITATVGKHAYLSWVYLDSSANHTDSIIEKHILKNLIPSKDVYSRWDSRWDVKELIPKLYPEYEKTGKTFRVFLGDGENPPRILEEKEKQEGEVIEVPIDALEDFKTNLVKSIRDIAGRPTVSEMKFIPSETTITSMFKDLWNIEAGVVVDAMDNSPHPLWEAVKDIFVWTGKSYVLKRAAKEHRFMSVDLAHAVKGDVAGVSMVHKEQVGHEAMYVVDFSFSVLPGPNGINLEAIGDFIVDLVTIGRVPIEIVSADSFYKESVFQRAKRQVSRIEFVVTSVDKSIDPYVLLLQRMLNGKVACGYNEYLFNNLKSLYRTRNKKGREIIDHSQGKTNHVFTGRGCGCGIHEKDVSDTLAASIWNAYGHPSIPAVSYEEENARSGKPTKQALIDRFYGKN